MDDTNNAAMQEYQNRKNIDYHELPLKDRQIIEDINVLLLQLSPLGKEYWEEYYT